MSHHTTLRRGRKAAAATVIAAAALALTACQGNSPKADPAGSPSPASSAGASGSSGSDSGTGSGSGTSGGQGSGTTSGGGSQSGKNGSGTGGSGGSASQTSSKDGSSARCSTGSLQAGWGSSGGGIPDMHSDAQQNVTVWLKNTGHSACTISGFPGVQLKANDGHSIDLPRSSKKPAPVTLKPGGSASFTITLLPSVSSEDRKIEPGMVLVTPPNEKQHFQLKWPYGGAILDQSGATHPGTYVNPVNAA
ncbi:hypothetical protein HEK616_67940 [Streptomyces nigrescens]|uniref:DUF4232 domain-containing protein n=2 Tax=Streptomyces TaxID=1883 RepID=A0ABM8A3W1_STRNI|nr:DUF4232 domain-containing protein [Streptomyces nigrescens]MEE4425412.1 DUF4232 domain-containing protein [Streptomyces sp. DSM 41528]BDM73307.1 hypothetical protein HEK616_67940 [Streptomyces nigrescens]